MKFEFYIPYQSCILWTTHYIKRWQKKSKLWPRTSCLDFKQNTKKQVKMGISWNIVSAQISLYISSVHIILDLEYNSTRIHVSHFCFANYKQPN